ncbi:MAG: ChbG/HpnK family deacetylase [Clostridium sp.]
MSNVLIHADDYAISDHVSESVCELIKKGAIDSISVMPNMKTTESGIAMLAPYVNQVLISIHLNLVEGKCIADPKKIPCLVSPDGFFKLSWMQIMIKSWNREFRIQAAIEFCAQIERTQNMLRTVGFIGRIRIDSHQHIHMIPGLFATVCGLSKEFDIEYIRLTREPLLPFFKATSLWKTYHVVNITKNILMNLFSLWDRRWLKRLKLEYHYFFGLLITGKMDYDRVRYLISLMPHQHTLEVVFHVGRMLESEITDEYNKKSFIREHISSRRLLELETVVRLWNLKN